jgi:hypothetical protein
MGSGSNCSDESPEEHGATNRERTYLWPTALMRSRAAPSRTDRSRGPEVPVHCTGRRSTSERPSLSGTVRTRSNPGG